MPLFVIVNGRVCVDDGNLRVAEGQYKNKIQINIHYVSCSINYLILGFGRFVKTPVKSPFVFTQNEFNNDDSDSVKLDNGSAIHSEKYTNGKNLPGKSNNV